jgi:hypothetical protein
MKGILALAAVLALASPAPPQAAGASTTPNPQGAQQASAEPPLRSEAALAAYLKANAGKPTPLDALSPLARKRFLESLRFGATGADPYAYERHDLARELTAGQIRSLLGLFGIEPDEFLLSLARTRPKTAARIAAEARPSAIAIAYDGYRRAFALAEAEAFKPHDSGYSDLELARVLGRTFDTAFGTPTQPSSVSDSDLELLHHAASLTAFYGDEPRYARLQLGLFEELAARGLAAQADPRYANASLLKARLFDDASHFAQAHPGEHIRPLPTLIGEPRTGDGVRMVWTTASDSRSLRLEPLDLGDGIRIVAIVGTRCGFSLNAMQAIRTDPQLRRAFDSRVTWLSLPPGWEDFDLVQAWNREHPTQPMVMAYAKQDWPIFRGWGTPRFHFFRDGQRVAHIIGWEGEKTRRQVLAMLEKLDAVEAGSDGSRKAP